MLTLDGVTFRYGPRFVVENVSLHIPDRSLLGLIGPNGSGKTTLLRLMSKILRPDQGRIFLRGRPLDQYGARELARQMAVITSEEFFEFPFTVHDVIAMGRIPHQARFQKMSAQDEEIVEEALRLTATGDLRLRSISDLSSGERQRVLIARAIAQQPTVLMLDEPNAHLDIHHQIQIFNLLRQLNRDHGMTLVVVLHDLTAAAAFCQRLALLHEGKVFREGPPAEVITSEVIHQVYGASVLVQASPAGQFPIIAYGPES